MRTAQVLIIGNEILSGRTEDTNSHFLAKRLHDYGIKVTRIFVVPDETDAIVAAIRQNHQSSDYFFVAGGIGATPDDKTRKAVAVAMGTKLVRHPEVERRLREFYLDDVNEARLSMADLPEGALLIDNPLTKAPGFKVKNLYVFAGIPRLLQAMFQNIEVELETTPVFEREIFVPAGEGQITELLKVITAKYPDVELGSYPQFDIAETSLPHSKRHPKTILVFKGLNKELVEDAFREMSELIARHRL